MKSARLDCASRLFALDSFAMAGLGEKSICNLSKDQARFRLCQEGSFMELVRLNSQSLQCFRFNSAKCSLSSEEWKITHSAALSTVESREPRLHSAFSNRKLGIQRNRPTSRSVARSVSCWWQSQRRAQSLAQCNLCESKVDQLLGTLTFLRRLKHAVFFLPKRRFFHRNLLCPLSLHWKTCNYIRRSTLLQKDWSLCWNGYLAGKHLRLPAAVERKTN
jgi:hypothetical protein